jgi:hypothetical protein
MMINRLPEEMEDSLPGDYKTLEVAGMLAGFLENAGAPEPSFGFAPGGDKHFNG